MEKHIPHEEKVPTDLVEDVDLAQKAAKLEKPYRDQARGGKEVVNEKLNFLDIIAVNRANRYLDAVSKIPKSENEKNENIDLLKDEVRGYIAKIIQTINGKYHGFPVLDNTIIDLSEEDFAKLLISVATAINNDRLNYHHEDIRMFGNLADALYLYKIVNDALEKGELILEEGKFRYENRGSGYIAVEDKIREIAEYMSKRYGAIT